PQAAGASQQHQPIQKLVGVAWVSGGGLPAGPEWGGRLAGRGQLSARDVHREPSDSFCLPANSRKPGRQSWQTVVTSTHRSPNPGFLLVRQIPFFLWTFHQRNRILTNMINMINISRIGERAAGEG